MIAPHEAQGGSRCHIQRGPGGWCPSSGVMGEGIAPPGRGAPDDDPASRSAVVHDPASEHDDAQHDPLDVDHPEVHDDDAPIVSLQLHDHYHGVFKHHRRTYVLYESCYLVNDGPLQHYDDQYDLDNYRPDDHDAAEA